MKSQQWSPKERKKPDGRESVGGLGEGGGEGVGVWGENLYGRVGSTCPGGSVQFVRELLTRAPVVHFAYSITTLYTFKRKKNSPFSCLYGVVS